MQAWSPADDFRLDGQGGLAWRDKPVLAGHLEIAVLEQADSELVVVRAVTAAQGGPGAVDRERPGFGDV